MKTIIFILAGVGVLTLLTMVKRSRRRKEDTKALLANAKIGVCVLGANQSLVEQAKSDYSIYLTHFPKTELIEALDFRALFSCLGFGQFNIIHLLAEYDAEGNLIDDTGQALPVAAAYESFRAPYRLFLYLASSIGTERKDVLNGLLQSTTNAHKGGPLDVVVTIERGVAFYDFLNQLVTEIKEGRSLNEAWLRIRPQDMGAPAPADEKGPWALLLLDFHKQVRE